MENYKFVIYYFSSKKKLKKKKKYFFETQKRGEFVTHTDIITKQQTLDGMSWKKKY